MEFIRIRNWDKFQHYKKRNPPWIKLDTGTLDDYEYSCLSDSGKALFFTLLLAAARTNNKIPLDIEYIKRRGSLDAVPDLEPLFSMRFIEVIDASSVLAPCKQSAMPEERRGEAEQRKSESETEIQTERQKAFREEAKRIAGGMRLR